jgi:isoquinoline 1-oxidoreductase subunit beta
MKTTNLTSQSALDPLQDESVAPVGYDFGLSRRSFAQVLGTGLLIAVSPISGLAQRRGGVRRNGTVGARIHVGQDGLITVLTGKIEMGQGARAELTQAAAEELRVSPDQVRMIMGDTSQVPDDGLTAGSRTTPSTVPAVRQGAAAARRLLVELASRKWNVDPDSLQVRHGSITDPAGQHSVGYADLAQSGEGPKALEQALPEGTTVTSVKEWKVLGRSLARPNARDLVTGAHRYPSDQVRPGMLYGKVLRPPSYGATLTSVDPSSAKAMKDVVVVQDGGFVGVAAPTLFRAEQALASLEQTAVWAPSPHPSSKDVFAYLRDHAQGGVPQNSFTSELADAKQVVRQTYHVAYVQHAPMEPRVALAEWEGENLTVWTGTQNPFGYHAELARAFHLPNERVRVLVPDFGGGFGGKHTGEAAVEAARLAKAAGKPVLLRWTRQEEFTWAYFRPAAVIEAEASLDGRGTLTSWHFVNINAGGAAVETPYRLPKKTCRAVGSSAPLRQGSYRALAANANNFARECFMDELSAAAGADPLEFRLAHLEHPRLRAVLETAAKRFDWTTRVKNRSAVGGVGLACGTEKGSYVATCVAIELTPDNRIRVRHVCEVFECGAVLNPANLVAQIQGCIIMALGPALREAMQFEGGKMLNPFFRKYLVPRFEDVPELDLHVLDRPDLDSVGAGETPMIAVAPALANAVFHATGKRVRQMPIRFET